jgi:hypothetical protein
MRISLYNHLSRWRNLLLSIFLFTSFSAVSQTLMFDDFTYTGVADPQLPVFNKWNIIDGVDGPPDGGVYSKNNITFIADPNNSNNKLMTLSATVNGSSRATTHARIETSGYEYFEGTYAARINLSDIPFTYKDANIQTFYTIVSSSLAMDGTKYSELDIIEYMAADKWGISADNPVAYYTSWNKYQADPWQAWKTYFAAQGSIAGWHTLIAQCTDGVNVKYWIDDTYLGAQSKCDGNNPDNDTTSPVYPRSNMQVAFANWIWNNVIGSSTNSRTTTMQADWVLYYKNTALTKAQIDALVAGYRTQGLQRQNLAGQTYTTGTCNVPAQPGTITGNTSVASGSSNTYSIAAVSGATSYTWTLPSGWSGTSTTTSITTTAGSTGGTISVKAYNSCGVSTARTLSVAVTCSVPAQPGAISGNTNVTAGSSQTYSIGAVSGATSYTWTLPSGWTGSSTSTSITTTAGSAGGAITVKANNSCGSSSASSLTVTVGSSSPNLALNRPATASSVEPSTTLTASLAVDGNATTRWSSDYVDPSWIYVDLGSSYNVNRVKITWEAAYATAYQVQVSADAASWTTIKTVSGNASTTNDWTGLSGAGRYVRIYGTARATQWGYSIFELEVYGTAGCTVPAQPGTISGNTTVTAGSSQTYSIAAVSGATSYTWTLPSGWSGSSTSTSITATAGSTGGTLSVKANNACGASTARTLSVTVGSSTTNLALNKPTTVSSVEPSTSFNGPLAVDGNTTTRWSSNYVDPSWIYVDLGALYNVNRVKITWEAAYATAYQVQVSADASSWSTMKTVTGNATTTNDWTGLTGTGRYVRIYGTARNTQWGYSIFELEVYGTSAGRQALEEPMVDDAAITLSPNPAKTILNVDAKAYHGGMFRITDTSGREHISQTFNGQSIEITNLPSGMYVFKLSKGKLSAAKKFIKE